MQGTFLDVGAVIEILRFSLVLVVLKPYPIKTVCKKSINFQALAPLFLKQKGQKGFDFLVNLPRN